MRSAQASVRDNKMKGSTHAALISMVVACGTRAQLLEMPPCST